MKKRILAILLTLCLVLTLLPTVAFAAPATSITVAGTNLTTAGYWKIDNTSGVTILTAGTSTDYNIYFDGAGNLTLNDAEIIIRDININPYGIFALGDLIITLTGDNTIDTEFHAIHVENGDLTIIGSSNSSLMVSSELSDGIYVKNGDLLLNGVELQVIPDDIGIYIVDKGNITISNNSNVIIKPFDPERDRWRCGIETENDIVINGNSKVTIAANNTTLMNGGIYSHESVTISGSEVHIEVSGDGISGDEGVSLTSSNVTVNATEYTALSSSNGDISINGGTTNLSGADIALSSSNGDISINGGTTELTGGRAAIWYRIFTGGSLTTAATPICEGQTKAAATLVESAAALRNTATVSPDEIFFSMPYVSFGITPAIAYIWGKALTTSTPYYHNGANGAQGTVDNDPTGANAGYNPKTGVLTLDGLNATNSTAKAFVSMSDAPIYYGYAIYAVDDLTIDLTGDNTASVTGANFTNAAVYITGNLTIQGNGSLAASSTDSLSGENCGVLADGSITLDGCTIIAESTNTGGAAQAFSGQPVLTGYTDGYQWRLADSGDYTQSTATPYTLAAGNTYVEIKPAGSSDTYSVTLTPGEGYTLVAKTGSASPVEYGGSYTFKFALDTGYTDSTPVIKVNDTPVTLDANGEYTITNITAAQTVTVEGVTKNTFAVTLTPGTGYTLAAQTGSTSPVEHDGSYTFKFTLDTGYTDSTPVIKVNDTPVTLNANGEYTITNITAAQTVTVEGVTKNTYTVTLTPGTGYTLAAGSASPVEHGGSYTFTFALNTGYTDSTPVIKVNDTPVTLNANGEYTITNITAAQTVTVEGVTKNTYAVTLTPGTGYNLAAQTGSGSPVEHGGSYTFKFTLDTAYTASTPVIKVNDTPVTVNANGEYTITDITAAQTVTVEGVTKNTYAVTLTPGTGYNLAAQTGSASPVEHGGSYTLTFALNTGYTDSTPVIKVNDTPVTLDANGEYTITDITAAQTVSVEGVTKNTYAVTLTPGTGYTLAAQTGSASPVEHGGSYTFTFALDTAYTASTPVIKVNDTPVTLNANGEYTISDITVAQTVSVEGVTKNTYAVTVNGGTADNTTAAQGDTVTITAAAPAAGMRFKEWTISPSVTFTEGSATTATAKFTMPAEAVSAIATYEGIPAGTTYTVTVTNGTGGGNYAEGATVTITADAPAEGKHFKAWTIIPSVTFTEGSATTATAKFTMPAEAVSATATYEEPVVPGIIIPEYLIVNKCVKPNLANLLPWKYKGTVMWSSGDVTVLKIVKEGKKRFIKGIELGETTLTATFPDGTTQTIPVKVVPKKQAVTSMGGPDAIKLKRGTTKQLTPKVKPDAALDKTLFWHSSNEKIATVENGLITSGKRNVTKVTVTKKTAIEEVTLTPVEVTLRAGETHTLTATVSPADADQTLKWSSDKPKIASVKKGVVTAKKPGTATITCKFANGEKLTCEVIVTK